MKYRSRPLSTALRCTVVAFLAMAAWPLAQRQASAQINIEVGDLRVDATYLGASPTATAAYYEAWFQILSSDGQSVRYDVFQPGSDSITARQLLPGQYDVQLLDASFQPLGPLVPATVVARETVSVSFELADAYGLVTGTLLLDGAPGGTVSLQTRSPAGSLLGWINASGSAGPPPGAFAVLLPEGAGSGTAHPGPVEIPPLHGRARPGNRAPPDRRHGGPDRGSSRQFLLSGEPAQPIRSEL